MEFLNNEDEVVAVRRYRLHTEPGIAEAPCAKQEVKLPWLPPTLLPF